MTGPPAATPSTGSASIREQVAALKFRSPWVDVFEENRRVDGITEAEARIRLIIGGYEAVGHNTVKYIRRLAQPERPTEGPQWKGARRAVDSSTVRKDGINYAHRFAALHHPWPRPGVKPQKADREETATSSDFAVTR